VINLGSGETLLFKIVGGILLLDGAISITMKKDTRPIRIVESATGFAMAVA